ncbi:MAG: hypothetical protein JOY96_01530, partial [Verrucomicrobia bacterium]|nr:hypothetical protein [Verrucomicrobiota bacterium]
MSEEAIVISLDEEVACPSDREHRFPLRLGLAESTVRRMQESLSEQIGQAKKEIRAALEQEYTEAKTAAVRELESQLLQARSSGQEKLERAIAEADQRLEEERKRWRTEEERKSLIREQTLREQLGST